MKILKSSTLLVLLSLLYSFGLAQFTVNQNISYTAPDHPDCYNTVITSQTQWQGTVVSVNTTNNISSPTSPYLEDNLNLQAWRLMHFDIYHDDGNQLTLIKTVTRYHRWIKPYNTSYSLGSGDLDGVPEGNTVVILRVENDHNFNSPYVVNLDVDVNGSDLCDYADFEGTSYTCTVGMVDCFYYIPCGEVQVLPMAFLCPTIGGGTATCYRFTATVPGGSGNYTYNWNATHKSGAWSSTNPTFNFQITTAGHPVVTLHLIDNVTGCEYHFTTGGKRAMEFEIQKEDALTVGPNPTTQGGEVTLNFINLSEGNVSISLYDLQGREVQRVYDAAYETAGMHDLKFVPEVPAGLYLVGMKNAEGFTTQKLLIQK